MQVIDISIKDINEIRNLPQEFVWTFKINKESCITNLKQISLISNVDYAIACLTSEVDGILHNHIEESDISEVDIQFQLPNLYYIIVTPTKIIGRINAEIIECRLH